MLETDIPGNVYKGLLASKATDVHVFGRRGPAQVKFSPLELREAVHVEGVDTIVHDEDFVYDEGSNSQIESNNQPRVNTRFDTLSSQVERLLFTSTVLAASTTGAKVTSFVSSTLAVAPTFEAMLFINEIGCSNNIVCNGPFAFQGYSGGYIGILRDNVNELFLGSSITDNPPSFLRARPTANQINVKIHRNNASLGTDYAPLPAKYTLVLSFEQLND
jgi:hypothetical protein